MKTQLTIALATLALAACSQGENTNATQTAIAPATTTADADHVDAPGTPAYDHREEKAGDHMAMMTPAPNDTAATRSYKQSMAKMMSGMPAYTQDADIDFNQQMKVHHQAAIDMAEIQLANGKDPASRTLAQEIIGAQRREIAQIDAWLAKRGQ